MKSYIVNYRTAERLFGQGYTKEYKYIAAALDAVRTAENAGADMHSSDGVRPTLPTLVFGPHDALLNRDEIHLQFAMENGRRIVSKDVSECTPIQVAIAVLQFYAAGA